MSFARTLWHRRYLRSVAALALLLGLGACAVPVTLSSNATLASLVLSAGTLTPAFDPAVTSYGASVENTVDSVTVTATTATTSATVDVDGSGGSASVALAVGANEVEIVVTAENGGTATTTLTVTRAAAPPPPPPGSDANLSDLTLSAASLAPAFQASQLSYTATVPFVTDSTTVTATAAAAGATLTVNGAATASGAASTLIALSEGSNAITVEVTAQDGTTTKSYTIDVTRQSAASFAQQAYAKASNTDQDDTFGYSVDLHGDTLVVGAPGEDSEADGIDNDPFSPAQVNDNASAAGAAYVFVRSGDVWSQEAYVKASNSGAGDQFGIAVAIDGDTLAVGAWREASDATGVGGDQGNDDADGSGAVYIFTRTGTVWSQQVYLKASNAEEDDAFGFAVDLSGETLVVGARDEKSDATGVGGDQGDNSADDGGIGAGAAYVFIRNGTVWTQQAYLKASNTGAGDMFGFSVAIDGDTVAVGAIREASGATGIGGDQGDDSAIVNGFGAGAVYVFTRSGSAWSQQAYVKASNTDAGDRFGFAVALSGDTLAVGAPREASDATGIGGDQADDSTGEAGAVYVFTRAGSSWSQQAYVKASNTGTGGGAINDQFGWSVALDGDTLLVGALTEDSDADGVDGDQADDSAFDAGAAYVFSRAGSSWSQVGYIKASNSESGDQLGMAVAVDGDTLAVASSEEDGSSTGIDGIQNNGASRAGAVYVFR